MFGLFEKEKIYIDRYDEYKKKVGEYILLGFYRIVGFDDDYSFYNKYIGEAVVLVNYFERHTGGVDLTFLFKNGEIENFKSNKIEIEEYYGEFHEEIKTMKEVEALSKELEEKTKALKEKANKLSGISKEKLIEAHKLILKNNNN